MTTHDPRLRPRFRGVTHEWAFFASTGVGAALIVSASGARATVSAAIFAGSVAAMFGASALYHRVTWRPSVRRWMRRLDHAMIFVLIAGTYTPFALLAFDDGVGRALLIAVWTGAGGGVALKLLWIDAPKWLGVVVYVGLGWVAIWTFPALADALGIVPTVLVGLGGLLYTTGAVIYATRRPDPAPAVFGYHEVFHLLVVIAAALQYAVVVFWVLL
ncbi:MAG: hemolysin III family protein [Gaiellaceae bacterium]